MFEEGNLLLFHPFLFKNGAHPKDKFFLVIENIDGELLLASLPTSKDHVPSDIEIKHGCLDLSERFVNVFVFLSGEEVLNKDNGKHFSFSKNTFIYGADLDMYNLAQFELQERLAQTNIELVGCLDTAVFLELKDCLANSKMVKNRYRRLLSKHL